MKYPSVWISQFADWLETYEPHEKIEALADCVESLEEPLETRLDWIYERVTAYRRLQETRAELERAKRDRTLLARNYIALYKRYRQQTGEKAPVESWEVVWAARRGLAGALGPTARRLSQILDDLRYKTRG